MKILIVEQPVNNRGDESAHRGFLNRLSMAYPDARIQVLFFEKLPIEVDEMRVNRDNIEYINIPVRHKTFAPHRMIKLYMMFNMGYMLNTLPIMHKIKKLYKDADMIICAPGGIDMGGFQNWVHIALLELARKMKKKTIYFARSIGPFPTKSRFNKLFKKRSLRLLKGFDFISLRDKKSQDLAKSLDIQFTPTIDSAFLYYMQKDIPDSFKKHMKDNEYMVLVPNSLAWHHDFKDYTHETFFKFWVQLANRLLKEYPGINIAMLPQTVNYGYAVNFNDGYKYFCRIRKATDAPERIFVLEEEHGSDIQQNIISKAKFLIGARYHSIIFSINQNTPFISLCYEHKMKGVTEMLGKEDIDLHDLFNGKKITPEATEDFIERIIHTSHNISQDKKAQQQAQNIANEGFQALIEYINKKA